jgi:hypothetical protein
MCLENPIDAQISDNQKSLIGIFWSVAVVVDSILQAILIFLSDCFVLNTRIPGIRLGKITYLEK